MGWADHSEKPAARWHATPRVVLAAICCFLFLLGSWSHSLRSASATLAAGAATVQVVAEADHAAPRHPCKQGMAAAAANSCAVSGFSAGLPSADTDQAAPAVTTARLGPALHAGLAHQWRTLPPDRPPRI
jgi:hypothetical protein